MENPGLLYLSGQYGETACSVSRRPPRSSYPSRCAFLCRSALAGPNETTYNKPATSRVLVQSNWLRDEALKAAHCLNLIAPAIMGEINSTLLSHDLRLIHLAALHVALSFPCGTRSSIASWEAVGALAVDSSSFGPAQSPCRQEQQHPRRRSLPNRPRP